MSCSTSFECEPYILDGNTLILSSFPDIFAFSLPPDPLAREPIKMIIFRAWMDLVTDFSIFRCGPNLLPLFRVGFLVIIIMHMNPCRASRKNHREATNTLYCYNNNIDSKTLKMLKYRIAKKSTNKISFHIHNNHFKQL